MWAIGVKGIRELSSWMMIGHGPNSRRMGAGVKVLGTKRETVLKSRLEEDIDLPREFQKLGKTRVCP